MIENLFLIAKYTPDLLRHEPRNIGILVYDEGRWSSRFFGEMPDGSLNGGRVRRRVNSIETYREWLRFWRDTITEGIDDFGGRGCIAPDDPLFVEALCAASQGNYAIELGRPLMLPTECYASEGVLAHLYRRLVEDESPIMDSTSLPERMQRIAQVYRLSENPHFREDYTIDITVGSEPETRQ